LPFILVNLLALGSRQFASIEITLISPTLGEEVEIDTVVLEGLVSDLSVTEIKVLVNSQPLQFVPVRKGYFEGKLFLDQRVNRVTLYGANASREYFRQEYEILNKLKRKKSISERIAPRISLNHLEVNQFKILSPVQFAKLNLNLWDNKDEVVQVGYTWNDSDPVYLRWKGSPIDLNLKPYASLQSYFLHIFAIDGDGNQSRANFHFRVEKLECELSVSPLLGLFESTPVHLEARISGGKGVVKKIFSIKSRQGVSYSKESTTAQVSFQIPEIEMQEKFTTSLHLVDENSIHATCSASNEVHLFSERMPRIVEFSNISKLESVRQILNFRITPPVRRGRVKLFLKSHDPITGFSQRDWKTLGLHRLQSPQYRREWTLELRKRVRPGNYLLKMSLELSGNKIQFTEMIPVTVVRSANDDVDLLQEILRDEGVAE
jgi:hypothetical protein